LAEAVFRIAGSLLGALFMYLRIGWWGLVTPRMSAPLVVAQAVIRGDAGLLLAVRGDLRGWELPGGTLEAGESGEAAVCREVLEETGLEVEVERFVGDYERSGFRPHTAKVYLCRVVRGDLQTSHESLDLRWFAEDALPKTLFAWYLDPIRDAGSDAAEPVRREESQGLREVLAAIRIDLRMRISDNRAL
jgi:8-oxo-dGTP diphosphatase